MTTVTVEFAPGDKITTASGIDGVVTAVQVSFGTAEYRVVYWDKEKRCVEWVHDFEIKHRTACTPVGFPTEPAT